MENSWNLKFQGEHKLWLGKWFIPVSGIAIGGPRGQSAALDSKKFAKNQEKEGENQEKSGKKREKSGKRRTNPEGSFTLPLLTDRAG